MWIRARQLGSITVTSAVRAAVCDYDVDFEFIPVVASAETRAIVAPFLDEA